MERGRRLGELLVEQGQLSPEQLEPAVQMQVAAGGRLGTVLIELRSVGIDAVGQALAVQHGIPEARPEDFEQVQWDVISTVPVELVKKHVVVPLRLEGQRLLLAMRDPHDIAALDEISFVVSARIQPCAAAELRLFYYIERHYRVPRLARYVRVPDSLMQSPVGDERRNYLQPSPGLIDPQRRPPEAAARDPEAAAAPPPAEDELSRVYLDEFDLDVAVELPDGGEPSAANPPPPAAEVARLARTDGSTSEILRADTFDGLGAVEIDVAEEPVAEPVVAEPVADTVGTSRVHCANCAHVYDATPPLVWTICPRCGHSDEEEPWTLPAEEVPGAPDEEGEITLLANARLDAACGSMAEAADREAVLRGLVGPVLANCAVSVLFSVRQQLAVGVAAWGTGSTALELQALVVPMTTPSLLQRGFAERAVLRGTFGDDPILAMVAGYLRGVTANEALVAPVVLGGRIFTLLCCGSEPGKPFGPRAELELELLVGAAEARLVELMRSS